MQNHYTTEPPKKQLSHDIGQFAAVPFSIIDDRQLSGEAKLLAVILVRYSNKDTGDSFPSYEKLQEKTGWGRTKIARALKELSKSYFKPKRRFSSSTIYTPMFPFPVVPYQDECERTSETTVVPYQDSISPIACVQSSHSVQLTRLKELDKNNYTKLTIDSSSSNSSLCLDDEQALKDSSSAVSFEADTRNSKNDKQALVSSVEEKKNKSYAVKQCSTANTGTAFQTLPAKFDGTCAGCRAAFKAGTPVNFKNKKTYLHQSCVPIPLEDRFPDPKDRERYQRIKFVGGYYTLQSILRDCFSNYYKAHEVEKLNAIDNRTKLAVKAAEALLGGNEGVIHFLVSFFKQPKPQDWFVAFVEQTGISEQFKTDHLTALVDADSRHYKPTPDGIRIKRLDLQEQAA